VPSLLKAFPAQYRPTLGRTEWDRRLFAALRATGPGFRFGVMLALAGTHHRYPFTFAVFAAFGFVLELLVVKKQLFARREHEVRATIHALQLLVLEFHAKRRSIPRPCASRSSEWGMIRFRWAGDFSPS
jgi:hypothetical protein